MPISSSSAYDESFNLSHTLAAHTRLHLPHFSGTAVEEWQESELKTEFIFRLVEGDERKSSGGAGAAACVPHLAHAHEKFKRKKLPRTF